MISMHPAMTKRGLKVIIMSLLLNQDHHDKQKTIAIVKRISVYNAWLRALRLSGSDTCRQPRMSPSGLHLWLQELMRLFGCKHVNS